MKKLYLTFLILTVLFGCGTSTNDNSVTSIPKEEIIQKFTDAHQWLSDYYDGGVYVIDTYTNFDVIPEEGVIEQAISDEATQYANGKELNDFISSLTGDDYKVFKDAWSEAYAETTRIHEHLEVYGIDNLEVNIYDLIPYMITMKKELESY